MSKPEGDRYTSLDELVYNTASLEGVANSQMHIPKEEGEDQSETPVHGADEEDVTVGVSSQLDNGVGGWRSRPLQWIVGGPKAFAFWSMLYILMKVTSGLYTGAIISTIEKQFKLSSTESGAILILNDAMDLSLVLFVAYFGQSRHRPRIIAVGTLIAGIGMLMCAMPHLTLEPYTDIPKGCNQTDAFVDYCSAEENVRDPCKVDFKQPAVDPVVWLILGQILLGIGNVPIKPLGTTYIDDAVGKHTTPLYIAFLFISASGGSLIGLLLGSATLSLFVDFDRVALEDRPKIDANDPRFIGAWWLGFLVIGCVIVLLSVPFFFFPRHLPKTKERMKEEAEEKEKALKAMEGSGIKMEQLSDSEANKGPTDEDSCQSGKIPFHMKLKQVLMEMYFSYKKLFLNAALVLLCLSTASTSAVQSGIASFGFKYYGVMLEVPDSIAPLLALAIVPFLIGGNLIGGVIIRVRKWSTAKCALLLLFGDIVGVLCAPAFLTIGCDTVVLAGISAPYKPPAPYGILPATTNLVPARLPNSVEQAKSPCNLNCTCGDENYSPVCGADSITYVSPCYAGCEVVVESNKSVKSFSDCQCIDDVNATAVDGQCPSVCESWYIPAIIVVSIVQFFCSSLGATGIALITLRIVDEDMRATALGFQTLVLNLLGYFIAPVYFGALVNLSCILWGYDNGERGACSVYSNDLFRYTFQGTIALLKVSSGLLLTGVYLLLRDPQGEKYKEESTDKPQSNPRCINDITTQNISSSGQTKDLC